MPDHAWEAIYTLFPSAQTCVKCKEKRSKCICWDIFCRRCIRMAEDCDCADPVYKHRACSACGSQEVDTFSLFDDSIAAAFLPLPPFGCHVCGHDSPSATEFYIVQSAKKCGICLQLGYHQFEWCEGQSCESENMFHTKCMTKINKSWFCDACVAAGAVACVGSDEDGFAGSTKDNASLGSEWDCSQSTPGLLSSRREWDC